MTIHNTLTGSELHYPLGHSTAGALTLIDNTANAFLVENTGGNTYFAITTLNGGETITLGGNDNPRFRWLGTGPWQFNGSDGTSGQVLTSAGSGGTPTWTTISTSGITGTTNVSWTINSDAANTADENALLILISSDDDTGSANDDLVRATLTNDGPNERLYWTVDRNRAGAGYSRIAPNVGIGTPSSTTSGFDPILSFFTGDGTSAYTGTLTYLVGSAGGSRGYLRYSDAIFAGPSGAAQAYGWLSRGSATTSCAFGAGTNGGDGTAIGSGAVATGSESIVLSGGNGTMTASATSSICIGPGSSAMTAGHTRAICIGTGPGGSAVSSTATNQCLIGTSTMILGEGDTNGAPPAISFRLTNSTGSDVSAGSLTITPGRPTGSGNGGDLIVTTAPPGASSSTLQSAVERLRITDTGEVGIGNVGASPSAHVHVLDNNSSTTAIIFLDQDGSGDAAIRWDAGAASFSMGVDNSASDALVISENATLGTNNRLEFATSNGAVTVRGTSTTLQAFSAVTGSAMTFGSSNTLTTVDTGTATFDITLPVSTGAGYIHYDVIAVRRTTLDTAVIPKFVHWETSAGTATIIADTQDTDFDSIEAGIAGITAVVTATGGSARLTVTGVTGGGTATIDWWVHYRMGGGAQT